MTSACKCHLQKFINRWHVPELTPEQIDTFLAQPVDVTAAGCWLWQKGNDYGLHKINDRPWGAHRIAYRIFTGEDVCPKVMPVHHRCENKRCVNPDHLEAIPYADHFWRHHQEVAA